MQLWDTENELFAVLLYALYLPKRKLNNQKCNKTNKKSTYKGLLRKDLVKTAVGS